MNYTIKEIARAAGVSITTVSLVMNGKAKTGRIHPDTEKRVLELAQQVNYVPNKTARRFRTNRSETIGMVAPDAANPFFSDLSYALEQVLKRRGYQLLIGYSDDQAEIEAKVIHNLLSYSIEGLIITSVNHSDQTIMNIRKNIPVVFIDREIHSQNISSVSSDNFQGAFDAVNALCLQGVTDIYHIGGLPNLSTTQQRLQGYVEALKRNGLKVDHSKIFLRDYHVATGTQAMKEIYDRLQSLPQAIFTGSYVLLEGCLRFIDDLCHTIPKQIRIATFDDHPLLDFLPNKIISVRQDAERLASEAVQIILDVLQGKSYAESRKIMPKLIVRN